MLFVHVKASSSMKRVEEASDASARSPCRAPGTATSTRCTAPAASDGRSSEVSTANSRWPTGRVGVPQSRAGAAGQAVEAERLQLDLPVEADDADLRERDGVPEPHGEPLSRRIAEA